jgi:hypothetical protein
MPRVVAWVAMVLWGVAVPVWGEPPDPLRFFACGVVQFFGEACAPAPVVVPSEATGALAPALPSAPAASPLTAVTVTPVATPPPGDILPPLFPPETVSPDMPPLLLKLLHEPTTANARAFLAWQRARWQRIQAVQTLLRTLQTADPEAVRPPGEPP